MVKKLLLAGDIFISEMHLRQPGFTYSAYRTFTKNKKQKNSKKQKIGDIFTKTSKIKIFFNLIWLMEILQI